jgi:GT2 family glycosyltransferase
VPAGLEAGFELLRVRDDVAAVQGVVRRAADHDLERTFGREPGLADLVAHRLRLRQRVGERVLRLAARFVGLRHFAVRLPDAATVPTPFLAAVAPLIRAAAFAEVGGFDEDYFLYAEDVDLSRRLRRAGWSLLSMTDPWAEHQGGASSAGTPGLRDRYWWQAHRRLVEKHWTGMRRAAGLALTHAYAGTRP